jgi:hypothetical protein
LTNQHYAILHRDDIRRIIQERQREAFRKSSESINHEFVRVMNSRRRRAQRGSQIRQRVNKRVGRGRRQ